MLYSMAVLHRVHDVASYKQRLGLLAGTRPWLGA